MSVAYCWRSGQIEFARNTAQIPDGAIPVAVSRKSVARLREIVEARARHAYDGKTLLVPGVPEAADATAAFDAMAAWCNWAFPGRRA